MLSSCLYILSCPNLSSDIVPSSTIGLLADTPEMNSPNITVGENTSSDIEQRSEREDENGLKEKMLEV